MRNLGVDSVLSLHFVDRKLDVRNAYSKFISDRFDEGISAQIHRSRFESTLGYDLALR